MGQFSWIASDDGKPVYCDYGNREAYLLIPEEFGGGYFHTNEYAGYGVIGGHDVYDCVAEWNKEDLPELLKRDSHYSIDVINTMIMIAEYWNTHSDRDTSEYVTWLSGNGSRMICDTNDWKRQIGIMIACYDEDNAALKYPIKITHRPIAYEFACASDTDPNQGWHLDEDEDEDEDNRYAYTEPSDL